MHPTAIRSHIGPRDVRQLHLKDASEYLALKQLGIGFDERTVIKMLEGMGMDNLQASVTTASITTPIQFLQNWLPGFVSVVTAARKIDELVGITTSGSWEDEEIVQGILESLGSATPYGDYTSVPFSSWNTNFERRTVVRFEEGMRVGRLEEARASRMNVSSASGKREAAAVALEIQRNKVGFYGFNNGAGRTYGFLNDPSLPAYVTVAATGTGNTTTWSTKSFLNITADLRTALAALQAQSQDVIDVTKTPITLALPTSVQQYMTVVSDFGISVRNWMNTNYPNIREVSAPELVGANGGANVFYLYAESVPDGSSDDGRTFMQVVPAKFQVVGVSQMAKGYEEDYTNATAGIMCKRPYAVIRRSGI